MVYMSSLPRQIYTYIYLLHWNIDLSRIWIYCSYSLCTYTQYPLNSLVLCYHAEYCFFLWQSVYRNIQQFISWWKSVTKTSTDTMWHIIREYNLHMVLFFHKNGSPKLMNQEFSLSHYANLMIHLIKKCFSLCRPSDCSIREWKIL